MVHLCAVVAAPLTSPPPASELIRHVGQALSPYIEAVYLNHGYRFFAPDPGPSHLLRYKITKADDSQVIGQFPDVGAHWPRLWYHRHFMLSETIANLAGPLLEAVPVGEMVSEQREAFLADKSRADALLEGVARYLLDQHDGEIVELYLRRHNIPAPWDVANGMRLDHPTLFEERGLGQFSRGTP